VTTTTVYRPSYWDSGSAGSNSRETCRDCKHFAPDIVDGRERLHCYKRNTDMSNTLKCYCYDFAANNAPASGVSTKACPTCYHEKDSYCSLLKRKLKDEKPCKEWRHFDDPPQQRGRKKKGAKIKQIIGARIVDGQVEDNMLERMREMQKEFYFD
jgi:hypothetical protein